MGYFCPPHMFLYLKEQHIQREHTWCSVLNPNLSILDGNCPLGDPVWFPLSHSNPGPNLWRIPLCPQKQWSHTGIWIALPEPHPPPHPAPVLETFVVYSFQ